MSRGTLWRWLLLVNFVVLALIGWAALHLADRVPPSPWASGTGCPPSDHANPWCIR